MKENRITTLKNENIIWIIYVLFAIAGIYANNLEIEDIKNNNEKNKKKYKSINIIIFLISIIIYIYFINLLYNRYKNDHKRSNFLSLIGSILIFIGGLLFLYVEITDEEVVPNEF